MRARACNGIGIEDIADVEPGDQAHDCADVQAEERAAQIQIGKLVIDVAVEDDGVCAGAERLAHPNTSGQRVEQVESEPDQGHRPRANVLVAAVDGLIRAAHAFFALEDAMSGAFAQPGESSYLIPEGDDAHAHASAFQGFAESLDLRALAGAIDAGEANRDGARGIHGYWGRPGLACESAMTAPVAAAAATIMPTRK